MHETKKRSPWNKYAASTFRLVKNNHQSAIFSDTLRDNSKKMSISKKFMHG